MISRSSIQQPLPSGRQSKGNQRSWPSGTITMFFLPSRLFAMGSTRARVMAFPESASCFSRRRRREKQLADSGKAITRALVEPIAKSLEGKKNIVIVPDGQLLWLPFDCLPLGSGCWMDDREIIYLNTSREL